MNKRERILGIDFVRAVCALGIIAVHFYAASNSRVKIFSQWKNGDWATVLVAIFLMISGAMLYMNNQEVKLRNVGKFYYKRAKTIYPAYWLIYIFLFLENCYLYGSVFYNGKPIALLFSLLGLDGKYMLYSSVNYYIIGEWFLASIIILYLLYPIVVFAFNKGMLLSILIVVCLYGVMLYSYYKNMNIFRVDDKGNLISSLLSFLMGMCIIRYRTVLLENRKVTIVCLAIVSILLIFPVSKYIHRNILFHVMAFGLFIILEHIGSLIMKSKLPSVVFGKIANLSYIIFLLQHVVIFKVLGVTNPHDTLKSLGIYLVIVVLCFVYSYGAQIIITELTNNKKLKT